MLIAFTGWAGSGKTEAAKYLKSKYGGEIFSFASEIKIIGRRLFGLKTKDRKIYQLIGEKMREIDPNVWVNVVKNDIELELEYGDVDHFYIDDLRRMNEYEMLKEKGFTFVRIVADEDLRIKRLIERDGHCDISLLYNESESGCAHLKMLEIENNGTWDDFYKKLDELVSTYSENKKIKIDNKK